jgi:hypothetical protein
MKRTLLLTFCQFWLLSGVTAFADVVTLKDGTQISGLVESGTNGEIRVKVGDNSQVLRVDQIQSIQFDASAPTEPRSITLPIGTEIAVRTIDPIDSKRAKDLSHEYRASLDDPVIVDGVTVVPANVNAFLRVMELKQPKFKRASMSISLVAVAINGQRVEVQTGNLDSQEGSKSKRTAIGAGGGAATGAAIGAIAGGGAGAGIGAGIGAAAGALGGMATGKGVEIASETRFTYTLKQPVVISSQEAPQ